MLTRQQMEDIIRSGRSVLHNGQVLTSIGQLPAESELAQGDVQRLEAVKRHKEEQLAKLQLEQERLSADIEKAKRDAEVREQARQAAEKAKQEQQKQALAQQLKERAPAIETAAPADKAEAEAASEGAEEQPIPRRRRPPEKPEE